MGKIDDITKEYMKDNGRFANVFNYFLFGGREVVKEETLRVQDPTELLSFFGKDDKLITQQKIRDVLKKSVIKRNDSVCFLLLGIENQTEVHYAMPVRNALYDAINYAAQVEAAAKKHRREHDTGTRGEFLSGFKKIDRLIPVINLTIYWNDGAWDAPRCLREMMELPDPVYEAFIQDYKLHVIVPSEIQHFDGLRSDLKKIFRFLPVKSKKTELKKLLETFRDEYSDIDEETMKMLHACGNIKFPEPEETADGRRYNMCKGIEDMLRDELEEGRAEGRADMIVNMYDAGLSLELICSIAKESMETICSWLTVAGRSIPTEK